MTRDRDEIEALLPFYANGTASAEERAAVEAALAEDPRLEIELAALLAIREGMQAEEVQSPGAFGLARLMRDVEDTAQLAPAANSATAPRPRLWQAVAAVAVVALLGQSLWLGTRGGEAGYGLAGGGEGGFVVAFDPDAPEGEIRTLLLSLGIEIAGGPSALGLYRLIPPASENPEALLALLRSSDLVEDVDYAK
ncbi:zf-HC2 domain-containing protein [Pseudooceanicola sp. 200-1SW]|uniref:zf-HC2 domain-containing protein n=1 Tax=Pseudooceanicola sp. 200-1SW TaxID=3425949 RepID=UPI003D7F746C